MSNAVIPYQPSMNVGLSRGILSLESQIEAAARANVLAIVQASPDEYTETMIYAMTIVEQLKQVNGLDLAAVLYRGKYLKMIREQNLLSLHPGQYTTLQEMAREQGISYSELSRTDCLVNVIFPWVEEHLNVPVAQLWESIGKSNFSELLPVLNSIITGELPTHGETRGSTERVLGEVRQAMEDAGEHPTEDEVRYRAVTQLLLDGELLTNHELRARIRPDPTPNIPCAAYRNNGHIMAAMRLTDQQWTMLQRLVGRHADISLYDDPSRAADDEIIGSIRRIR